MQISSKNKILDDWAKAALRAERPSRIVGQGKYNFFDKQGDPTDLLWCKNVTSLTGGSNRPPLVQKRDVTDSGIQPTSFGAKKRQVTDRGIQLTF